MFFGPRGYFTLTLPGASAATPTSYQTARSSRFSKPQPFPPNIVLDARDFERHLAVQLQQLTNPAQRDNDDTNNDFEILSCPGTSLIFEAMYEHNIGHGLWDNLYPAFVAALRFGVTSDPKATPLRFLPELTIDISLCDEPAELEQTMCHTLDILGRFGGHEMLPKTKLIQFAGAGHLVHFDEVIVGCGGLGQRVLQPDLALPLSRSPDVAEAAAVQNLRDRIWNVFGIEHHYHHHHHHLDQRAQTVANHQHRHLNGIIVHNKRHTHQDLIELQALVGMAQKNLGVTLRLVDLAKISPLKRQLHMIASMDLYISGPGTGLLLHPLMRDGTVVINLGSCRHPYENVPPFPDSMEECVAEGAIYQRALYYNSSLRLQGLQRQELLRLVAEAARLIRNRSGVKTNYNNEDTFQIPTLPGQNLSEEGRVFVEACRKAKPQNGCQAMLAAMDVEPCLSHAWPAFIVYERGAYSPQGYGGTRCPFPVDEFRAAFEAHKTRLAVKNMTEAMSARC